MKRNVETQRTRTNAELLGVRWEAKRHAAFVATGFVLVAAIGLLLSGCASRKPTSQPEKHVVNLNPEIIQIVKSLGKDQNEGFSRNVEDFKKLAQSPVVATELLISELEKINLIKLQEESNDPVVAASQGAGMWCGA